MGGDKQAREGIIDKYEGITYFELWLALGLAGDKLFQNKAKIIVK